VCTDLTQQLRKRSPRAMGYHVKRASAQFETPVFKICEPAADEREALKYLHNVAFPAKFCSCKKSAKTRSNNNGFHFSSEMAHMGQ
jgi:hypothetical protein